MDISALQAFLAVAESGSFSRAAERIYLTQPAISKRIAALEKEIGARLFDRIGRGIHLTPAGEALLSRARNVLKELEDVKRGITNLSGSISGELLLATSHHIGLHRLPGLLKRFHETYTQVRLNLQFMDSEKACQAVARGELELAVVTLPPETAAPLKTEKIWDDPLDIVVSPGHPLARELPVTLSRLLDYPAILPGSRHLHPGDHPESLRPPARPDSGRDGHQLSGSAENAGDDRSRVECAATDYD